MFIHALKLKLIMNVNILYFIRFTACIHKHIFNNNVFVRAFAFHLTFDLYFTCSPTRIQTVYVGLLSRNKAAHHKNHIYVQPEQRENKGFD